MGRSAVSLLSPVAPEASACSAAGIHWALEDLVASCLHHRQWHEVQARSKLAPARSRLPAPACSCPSRPAPGLLPSACSCPSRPPPHEVGVCRRLCPVSFPDFVCLFGFARLLVSAPSRLQACSCPPACSRLPAPHEVGVCHRLCPVSFSNFVCLFGLARLLVSAPSRLQACSCPLYMKSVFVTGYALCHFPTSCDFPRPWPPPVCLSVAVAVAAPVCLSEAVAVPQRLYPHPRAHPRTRPHAVRGPDPRYGPNVTACRTRSPKLRCLPVPSGAVACSTGS